ncbi:hypothetical protein EMPS_07574 [Entomortierella parvispora]|uniref:Uncharacterized protein n=1 Tax=Entomortierella parvispora TaxID=205924 RepID=A0A9P3HED6_9FUNG|nr:hypothetical protein EMPS_07574 [Entomortierella parvispora]
MALPGSPVSELQKRAPTPSGPHAHIAAAPAPAPAPPASTVKPPPKTTVPKPKTTAPKPPAIPPTSAITSNTPIAATTTNVATSIVAPVDTTTSSIAPISSTGSESNGGASKSTNNTGMIAGIVAAGVVVLLLVGAGFVFRAKRRRGREASEIERYHQRSMMQKSSEGSSTYGYNDEGGEAPLHQPRENKIHEQRYLSNRQVLLNQQPEWFAKKSPLEYQSQVPPLEVLKQQNGQHPELGQGHQRQQRPPLTKQLSSTDSSNSNSSLNPALSTPSTLQPSSQAARSLTTSSNRPGSGTGPMGEFIPLVASSAAVVTTARPYQQHQYQQPRINTQNLRRSDSPGASAMSPTSQSPNGPVSPSRTLSPVGSSLSTASSGYKRSASASAMSNVLQSYTPPPPISPSSKPSPGFYDFLLDEEEPPKAKASSSARPSGSFAEGQTPMIPPPIPRATRPASGASMSSLKPPKVELKPDASAPEVPALPSFPSITLD